MIPRLWQHVFLVRERGKPHGTELHSSSASFRLLVARTAYNPEVVMIILNFSHPLVAEQVTQIETLTGATVDRIVNAPAQFDHERPFAAQAATLADACGLTPVEWQTTPLVIVPPALNFIAVTLLAELHGRMGYFPSSVRLRPVAGAVPPRFEVAEILALQEVRDGARFFALRPCADGRRAE